MRETINQAAAKANGFSRACGKCQLKDKCTLETSKVCTEVFIEGFKKGVNWNNKKKKKKLYENRM